MTEFLKQDINWNKFELLIDSKLFPKEIVLKAAYGLLDKGYFFFKFDENKNIILQFNKKEWIKEDPKTIIWNFSWELLNTYLRDRLEKENKTIREQIISSAIGNAADYKNFISIETNNNSMIDFNKDIDEILKEIEDDPDLKIDELEIDKLLSEIEEDSKNAKKKILNTKKVENAKKKFQDR